MPPPARTVGSLAQLACEWEVLARKAGNVCPGREYADLCVADFLASAAAIAPVLDESPLHSAIASNVRLPSPSGRGARGEGGSARNPNPPPSPPTPLQKGEGRPIGVTVLRCIEATRRVVATNTNLGIVLLLAPLASVPIDEPLSAGLERVLSGTTVDDAANVYAAIRLANPGGLGAAPEQDVRAAPTLPLRDVMALAQDRDMIARQYVNGFADVRAWSTDLGDLTARFGNVERAIVDLQIAALGDTIDSLIARKCGVAEAENVRAWHDTFAPMIAGAFLEFDAFLRGDNHRRNPGTTADLIAAALFVALRDGLVTPDTPFEWHDHPYNHPS